MKSLRPVLSSSWFLLAVCLALLAVITAVSMRGSSTPPALNSSSAQPDGGLALRLWLSRLGYDVKVSQRLEAVPNPSATLMLIMQGADISARNASDLLRWAHGGARLVIVSDGSTGAALIARVGMRIVSASAGEVRVKQPLLLAPSTAKLLGTATTVIRPTSADVTVAESVQGPVLTRRQIGRGQLWVLSAPDLLENGTIAKAGNRGLLLNLVGPRGRVLLDEEIVASPGTSADNWLASTVWGVALLFLLAIAIVYRWLSGWRLGPPDIPLDDRRRPASEYVIALAGLLRRARGRDRILSLYQQGLRRAARERFGDLETAQAPTERLLEIERLLAPSRKLSEKRLIAEVSAIVEMEGRVRSGNV